MLEDLIIKLANIYEKHGNIDVGFLNETGVLKFFAGLTVIPKHSTIVLRDRHGDLETSLHMKTPKEKTVIIF